MRFFCSVVAISVLLPVAGFAAQSKTVDANALILLDLAAFGAQRVAVGEAGSVLHSVDEGLSWQAVQAPTSRTLTSVVFVGDKVGIAVGHGGTLIRSDDAGASWNQIDVAKDAATDSLLGVLKLAKGTVIAYGAFGLYLESVDQGKTWSRRHILDEDFDRHISQIIEFGDQLLLIGESGTLAVSADQGQTWQKRESPYAGSFFGALQARDGALLIFGMRGNVYRSTDQGHAWSQIPMATKSCLNGGSIAEDGTLIIAGNNGLIASSKDNGQTFTLRYAPGGASLSRALGEKDGTIIYAGALAAGRLAPASAAVTVKP